ncbi:MAG TPA: hypothetical protein VNQ73_19860 [Ilumatobacter sp.]|nr:hypothetical protein [Ilumatobacter sp.]
MTTLPLPAFDLDPPGTYLFTVHEAVRGQRINRFALTLRSPERRAELAADEVATLEAAGLTDDEIELIRRRDWTALIEAGGHLQLLLVIVAALGGTLWDIGAHNAGCTADELRDAVPRKVAGLPATIAAVVR